MLFYFFYLFFICFGTRCPGGPLKLRVKMDGMSNKAKFEVGVHSWRRKQFSPSIPSSLLTSDNLGCPFDAAVHPLKSDKIQHLSLPHVPGCFQIRNAVMFLIY